MQLIGIELLGSLADVETPAGMYCDQLGPISDSQKVRIERWKKARWALYSRFEEAAVRGSGGRFDRILKSAERQAGDALQAAIDAYNYLEDDDEAVDFVHQQVHNIGEFTSGYFGCEVPYTDGARWDKCKVSLMHSRWGFSMGFTSTRLCSICSEDLDECEHLLELRYPMSACKDEGGRCNICGFIECNHYADVEYMVSPHAVHAQIDLREVSMVSRPRDPLLRPTQIELDDSDLQGALRRAPTDENIECFRCLGPCDGFSSPWSGTPATPSEKLAATSSRAPRGDRPEAARPARALAAASGSAPRGARRAPP